MFEITIKQLLEAGVHFGHPTKKWNPKMAEYIFTQRNGIHIVDLQKTVKKFEEAYNYVAELAAEGGTILFAGTKKQAADTIKEEAQRCGMYYVNVRWPGGMLTNFNTIRKSIKRLKDLEKMQADGTFDLLHLLSYFLLGKEVEGAVCLHLLEILKSLDGLANGVEVGKHTAGPTYVYVVHSASLSLFLNGVGCLLLGTDEEDGATLLRHLGNVVVSLLELLNGLLKVYDVNTVSLGEDVLCHLRVPLLSRVTEVNACFKQLLDGDFEHLMFLLGFSAIAT